jgi:hypothetical protein
MSIYQFRFKGPAMRFSFINIAVAFLLCACATTPKPDASPAVSMAVSSEQTTMTQSVAGNYPLEFPQTATPVWICERFKTSLQAAEQKTVSGYQIHQM